MGERAGFSELCAEGIEGSGIFLCIKLSICYLCACFLIFTCYGYFFASKARLRGSEVH